MAERRVAVTVDADVSPFIRGLGTAAAAAQGFSRDLESADSRMANLVQTGLALAPALVPLGAAAVPAVAGLAEQLGFAGMAAGTALLAFNGVGDALTALDKYKLQPTAANFAKLQQTMDKLGPSGQEFVLFIDHLEPKMRSLQAVAEAGLLPGVEDGLNHLLTLLPEVKGVVFSISSTLGQLVTDVGNHAGDPKWQEFFRFLDSEATPTLIAMGKVLGNVVTGMTSLVMDFNPMAQDFTHGMLDMSRSFAAWADGLDQTQGFQEFVAYIRREGPQAWQTLEAVANALVHIVSAAAPVGSVSLVIIKDLADALASIADSPAGPVLISTAAAVGVLGRSLALLKTVGLRGGNDGFIAKTITAPGKSAIATMREMTAATKELEAAQAATARERGLFAVNPGNVGNYTAALKREAEATDRVIRAEGERASALRGGMAAAGKAAGVVAGLAVATTGLADKTGLSNTASLALMGTIAGPWGAALGAGVGVTMDLAAANNDLSTAMSQVNTVAKQTPIDLNAQQQALTNLQRTTASYQASIQRARDVTNTSGMTLSGTIQGLKDGVTSISDLFTHSSEKADAAIAKQAKDFGLLKTGLIELSDAINGTHTNPMADPSTLAGVKAQNEELSKFASEVAPAAAQAGLNLRHILMTHEGWGQLIAAIKSYNAGMDSATGKSQAVGSALSALGSQLQSDATQADALASSLDALFGTQVSAAEATDQWIQGLQSLRKQIASTNGAIKGNSAAALANRAAIRSQVTDLQTRIAAEAKAGASGAKLAQQLLRGRDAIVAQATAAGAHKKDVEGYLKTLGMTPKNLKTIIETPGLLNAKQQVEALGRLYGLTPKEVKTLIRQAGMGNAQAEIDKLRRKYDLTKPEVKTIIKALDEASSVIAHIQYGLGSIHDKTVTVSVIESRNFKLNHLPGYGSADGSTVPKDGGPYADRYPYLLAPGEEVISNRYGQADRHRELLKAINAGRLADGGTAGWHWPNLSGFTGGASPATYTVDQQLAILQAEQQIRQLTRSLAKTGKNELDGLNRHIAQVQLEQAKQQLHQARRQPIIDQRQQIHDEIAAIRQAVGGFDVRGALGIQPRNPVAAGVRGDLASLKQQIIAAGGTWTKHLERMSDRMIRHAQAIDKDNRAIDKATTRHDRLEQTLGNLASQMDNLKSTMSQYGDSVAGNFLTNPFGLGGQTTTFTPTVQNSPALSAATDQLNAAKAHLSSLQSGGGDILTRLANAAQASRVEQTVQSLQANVDSLSQPITTTTDALGAFKDTLAEDTKRAQEMADALKTLTSEGLTGGLFQQLAASGDVGFAQELAAAGQSAVDNINALWNERATAAAQVAAYATQTVYGQQQAALQAHMDAVRGQIAATNTRLERLNAAVANQTTAVTGLQRDEIAAIRNEMQDIRQTVASIPRQTQTVKRKRGR
ncbi:MAG TPA: hypothetical protein VFH56_10905 [Acidimicrobiales bacterium]|nr:hypothetical protein [Acidimicrobiales bacterium]